MSLVIDSREVKKGDTFICIIGNELDGHDFIDDAINNGASVIFHSKPLKNKREGVNYIQVPDTVEAMNFACKIYFEDITKKMTVFGVTGTNGKTTVTNIIQQIFDEVKPCGYIGTIATRFRDFVIEGGLTTPNAVTLHNSLYSMKKKGAEAVALEASSQGIAMGRVDAVDFDYAIFTNLTHDHLDYHKTMEEYFAAKRKMFEELADTSAAVLNADSPTLDALRTCTSAKVITYGIENEADYRAENVKCFGSGSSFDLVYSEGVVHFETNLLGEYNVYNLLAAIAAMHDAGAPMELIRRKAADISQIAGRAEKINEGQDFDVFVDYAHTPDGYEKFFGFIKSYLEPDKRLIAVISAPGNRDESKRKELGEVTDKYADEIFLTQYDRRESDPEEIADMIMEGISDKTNVHRVMDRKNAIEKAIREAKQGDCVAVLGKGDEPYMYIGKKKVPWEGDNNIARRVLKSLMEEK